MSKRRLNIVSWLLAAFMLLGQSMIIAPSAQGADSINVVPTASGLQVSGSTLNPSAAVGVMVTQSERRVYLNQTISGASGEFTFTIPLAAGTYTVEVSTVGQTFAPAAGTVVSGGEVIPNPPPVAGQEATISITGYNGILLPATVVSWEGRATALSLLQQVAASHSLSVVVRKG